MKRSSLDIVTLPSLMDRTSGRPEVKIGLVDGPVATRHSDLTTEHMREIGRDRESSSRPPTSMSSLHGTFIAGILIARRSSPAPAICPGCTLLIRPLFGRTKPRQGHYPTATPQELAAAIIDCVEAGARVINLSLAFGQPSQNGEKVLEAALDHCMRRGVIVVAAAGNQGTLGSSVLTRHAWIIPVVGCDGSGGPLDESNFSRSIGRQGLRAPGDGITSLGVDGEQLTLGGTSVAVPFVTGAIALLWSEFPTATAARIKLAVMEAAGKPRRATPVPPLLDAAAAYQTLATMQAERRSA